MNPSRESSFAGDVLMVRPAVFDANAETAASNVFQTRGPVPHDALQRARSEWTHLRIELERHGVRVLALDDGHLDGVPPGPDALFPNNWFSSHADGRLVLYPMESRVRRREARPCFVERLVESTGAREVVDLRHHESRGAFLEGTGSLILDRERRVAFAALSSRTHRAPLAEFCDRLGYRAVAFHSELAGVPIYHTNVVLALGPDVALVGLDAVPDPAERRLLADELAATGRELLPLSAADLFAFAGNVLHLTGARGGVWTMSLRARLALGPRLALLERSGAVLSPSAATIETVGGGGVRCMLGELFKYWPRSLVMPPGRAGPSTSGTPPG
jgi:hypothetical protein